MPTNSGKRNAPRNLEQEPAVPSEPFPDSPSLLEQAEAILAGPPINITSRELGDAIEIVKIREGMEQERGPGTEQQRNSGNLVLIDRAAPNPNDSPLCHTPLIMPGGASANVTFDSSTTQRCSLAPADSQYQVSGFSAGGDSHLNFFGFTFNGVHSYGFCLDHTKAAPVGPYNNISADMAMPGQTAAVRLAVSFCIGNAPAQPSDAAGGQEFFEMLGLNTCPDLNGYDAYGVIQTTIWCLLGFGDPSNMVFLPDCGSTAATPKFPCLDAAVDELYNMAFDYANGALDCGGTAAPGTGGGSGSSGGSGGNCGGGNCADQAAGKCNNPGGLRMGCQLGDVFCCNTSSSVSDQSDTYLAFVGCANDLRECCGRVLLGPFKLASSNQGTPTITLTPCDGCQGADITLTDYCCVAFETPPTIGQEFYITFRPPCCKYCFDLCATMDTTAVAVYYFKKPNTNTLQPIGAPLIKREKKTTCIHVCIDITPPPPPPPEPEPWWEHILINNNNNNNNNDNNDNNSNSNLLSSILESLLSSALLSGGVSNLLNTASPSLAANGLPYPGAFAGEGPPGYYYPPIGPGGGYPGGPFPGGPGGAYPWGAFPQPGCCQPPSPPCPPPAPPPYPPPPPCPPPYPPTYPPPYPTYPPPPPLPCLPDPCVAPNTINLIVQPAQMPVYQALPLPVPCTVEPPPMTPYPQAPYPPMPYPPPYQQDSGGSGESASNAQQIYNPITVVMPPQPPAQSEAPRESSTTYIQPQTYHTKTERNLEPPSPETPWQPFGAQEMNPYGFFAPPPFMPPPFTQQPFAPPPPKTSAPRQPELLLLPEVSSAPHPDFSHLQYDGSNAAQQAAYNEFYREWYQE